MRSHKTIQQGRTLILYDPDLLSQVGEWLFEPAQLEHRGLLLRRTVGRRSAFVFSLGGRSFVLRHFWRGGLIGKAVSDQYLWTGLTRSRPLREWQVLQELYDKGLPVPQPAAVRLTRSGGCYRGDLITAQLSNTVTLADRLREAPLPRDTWNRIGKTLSMLHAAGADHADLNARNVLLDSNDQVFVIDWDRGRIRRPKVRWQRRNIERLFRSLRKIATQGGPLHYVEPEARHHLLIGYSKASDQREAR